MKLALNYRKFLPLIKKERVTILLFILWLVSIFFTSKIISGILVNGNIAAKPSQTPLPFFGDKCCINVYKPEPLPDPTPIPTLPPAKFQKRLFDLKKTLSYDIPYPAEIKDIPESQLIGLDCQKFTDYSYSEKKYNKPNYYLNYVYEPKNSNNGSSDIYRLNDERYIKIFFKASKDSSEYNLRSITFCQTDDKRLLVEYEAVPKRAQSKNSSLFFGLVHTVYAGGGGGNDVYIAEATNEDNLRRIAYLPVQPSAYWGCRSPLELTKDNIFYLLCGGGDGGGFGTAVFLRNIYKIDINSGIYSEILSCTTDSKYRAQCK